MENNGGSYIERYIINQLEELKKENTTLKKENEALKIENGNIDDKHVIGLPTLGVKYYLDTHSYYIERDNIAKYQEALDKKNFKWLQNHHYGINGSTWNYELRIGTSVALLMVSFYDGKLQVSQLSADYDTKEEAQDALLQELASDLSNKADYYKREDEQRVAAEADSDDTDE